MVTEGTKPKRKWDISTEEEAAEVETEHKKVNMMDQKEQRDLAVQMAIEAAKKIRLEIEAKRSSSTPTNTDLLEEPSCKTMKTEIDMASNKSEDVTSTENNTEKEVERLPFTKEIDISKSAHVPFLLTDLFLNRLKDKLQLGPSEQFLLKFNDNHTIVTLLASSEDLLVLAEKEMRSVKETGEFFSNKPAISSTSKSSSTASNTFTESVFLGFEPVPGQISFIRGKILGPQGSYLKHIQYSTNTRVQLKGRGSGHVDLTPASSDNPQPMHMWISAQNEEDLSEAKQLCEDLISTVRTDYEAKMAAQNRSRPAVPPPPMMMPPYPMAPMHMQPQPQPPYHPAYAQYYAQMAYMMAANQQGQLSQPPYLPNQYPPPSPSASNNPVHYQVPLLNSSNYQVPPNYPYPYPYPPQNHPIPKPDSAPKDQNQSKTDTSTTPD